jgi:hypothetical protein
MEPEGSGLYPEPDASSSHRHTLFFRDPFYYYIPIYAYISEVVLLVRFPDLHIASISHLTLHATCPTHFVLNLITLIILGEENRL